MALTATFKEITFGVGDRIKISQRIKEGGKERLQVFEGIVISIKGRQENKSFTVRKLSSGQIGVERIYPFSSPTIEKIQVVKRGVEGVNRAKLYFLRNKTKRETEKIYTRTSLRTKAK